MRIAGAALAIIVAALPVGKAAAAGGLDPPGLTSSPRTERLGGREAAAEFLRHLYAVYLGIRGCTEASLELGKPEFLPSVTLLDARRAMTAVDAAAKGAGLDVDGIWTEVAPLGVVTAEALKEDSPDHLANCRRIGAVFRIDLANLQNTLSKLGEARPLIEKDF